ncbi:hypothetical protein [Tsuneonella dongtanensis]|nr:hypothetical protein [Tsuneonella dongtanensis]
MGNKRLLSGPNEIINAERLFRQSVQRGKPDFRFVALAIGENPYRPPTWAIWECIIEKDRAARKAASGTREVSDILDEVVRFFAKEEFRRDGLPGERAKPAPSLRLAIRTACETLNLRTKERSGGAAEASWMKDVERAWKREQQEDVVDSTYVLLNWETTKRIDEIMHALLADEFGEPRDIQQSLWISNELERAASHDK